MDKPALPEKLNWTFNPWKQGLGGWRRPQLALPLSLLLAALLSWSVTVPNVPQEYEQQLVSAAEELGAAPFAMIGERQYTREQISAELEQIRTAREQFPRQWLQLHRLGMFPPDGKLYPDYDVWLEASMREEVVKYFREVFANDLPIDAFLASDWTMANPRLCDFYGLPEPKTSGFQRIALDPDSHRGGLLTMGAILGLTSDGTRHRPVHRGVWVSEAVFGKTPPPPPANVDPIEPNPPDSPKATIRQKIEAHARNTSCAACHRNIDPLGLAFDQYDAIGQWRTHERVEKGTGEDPPVDPSGTMPDGRQFADAEEFKHLLLQDRDRFLQAFVEHLCTYGLRRVLTVDDREDIAMIVHEAKQKNYRLKDIVRAVAISELIRKR